MFSSGRNWPPSPGLRCICTASARLGMAARWATSPGCLGPLGLEEFEQQPGHFLRLLLLHPVPRPLDQMRALELGADDRHLHRLEDTRYLVGAPIAFPRDEHGRHVDRAPREQLVLGLEAPRGPAAVPVEAALQAG